MRFIQTAHTGGDETAPFDVVEYHAKTVMEFVEELVPIAKGWGEIEVRYGCFTRRYEYRQGNLKSISIDPDVANLTIDKVKASGGWGLMDYLIFAEVED